VNARRADERRDRTCFGRCDLLDDGLERERRGGKEERAAADGRNQRDLVAVVELPLPVGVLAVDGVEQPRRLVAELEPRPDVADAGDPVQLALGPAGALTEPREQPNPDHGLARGASRAPPLLPLLLLSLAVVLPAPNGSCAASHAAESTHRCRSM